MGGVEVPQVPRGMERGKGYSLPTGGSVWGGGCAPFPRKFFVFFVENTIF